MNRNLTFVDFQNDFVFPNGALTFDNGSGDCELIERTKHFFTQLPHGYFTNAIVTLDTHNKETYHQSEEGKNFPIHCEENSNGWQLAINYLLIHDKIADVQYLRKNTYDMWEGTIDTVRADIADTKEVVLFGVASDICNRAALKGWLERGAQVTILEDLTRGIVKQTREVIQEKPFKQAHQQERLKLLTYQAFLKQIQHQRS